jgi:hypothetical protein
MGWVCSGGRRTLAWCGATRGPRREGICCAPGPATPRVRITCNGTSPRHHHAPLITQRRHSTHVAMHSPRLDRTSRSTGRAGPTERTAACRDIGAWGQVVGGVPLFLPHEQMSAISIPSNYRVPTPLPFCSYRVMHACNASRLRPSAVHPGSENMLQYCH